MIAAAAEHARGRREANRNVRSRLGRRLMNARIMQMKRFRNSARAEKFQFTESDKHTTV